MSIQVVFGGLGSRKTLFSIMSAYMIRDLMPFHYDIKANFNLKGSSLIRNFEDIERSSDSIMILDEAEIFMNSRNFKSDENTALANFGLWTRKRNLEVFFILPRLGSLDVNIRDIADYFHYMRLVGDIVEHHVYTHNMLSDEYDLIGMNQFHISDFEPYYSCYNTREIPTNFMDGASLKKQKVEKEQPRVFTREVFQFANQ